MAEKAKAKKAKALVKKTSVKSKKREDLEPEVEELQLQVEEAPKRALRGKAAVVEKPAAATAPSIKIPAPTSVSASPSPIASPAPKSVTLPWVSPTTEEKEIKAQSTPEIIAPIQPRVVVNKPEMPRAEPVRHEPRAETKRAEPENDGLRLRLSQSLTKKLKEQAADEGISLEEFVGELLAESVVLRAWEIVERKNAMKGPSQGSNNHQRPNSGGNPNSNQGGGNRGGPRGQNNNQPNKGHRGMSHVRYQTIMDDKATFLEYVRSQEKTRR